MTDTRTAERTDTLQPPLTAGTTTSLIVRDEDMRWMTLPQEEVKAALRASIYPGADPAMVDAVLGYCRVNRLNPMLRPVHIVPMWIPEKKVLRDGQMVKVEGTGMMRDVIMPSIGHYRIQAHRTGRYVGLSRPEWGPVRTFKFKNGQTLDVPDSVAIAVRVNIDGEVVEFWHEERFSECYATAGKDTDVPNAMWMKRPTGQMAKTGEAGALRKAFPELGDYTAEEMEGKTFDLVRGDDGVHRVAEPARTAASSSLDNFAGAGDGGAVKATKGKPTGQRSSNQSRQAAEGKDDSSADHTGTLVDEAMGKDESLNLPTEDTGEVPAMPEGIAKELADGKWMKAWRWISETMPTLGPKDRQALCDENAALLHRVRRQSAGYKGAVEEFVGRMSVVVPALPAVEGEQ